MGVALDSFAMAIEIAGTVAIIALIWSLFTRLRTRAEKRGIFQRFPVLLPAVTFVISLIIVGQLGILPIAQYKGENYLNKSVTSGEIFHFNVYESDIVYSENVELTMNINLIPDESINNTIEFYIADGLVETVYVNLTSTELGEFVTERRVLDLNPGFYVVRVNNTFFEHGIPDEMPHWIDITLSQSIKSSFITEMVTWSSIQFVVNIGCFFFILGGLCIGGSSKKRFTDEKSAEESWTDNGDGGPNYGKGC
jgi:hypothetical protein